MQLMHCHGQAKNRHMVSRMPTDRPEVATRAEFVDYMGDVPIFCWTGFEDEGGE